MIDRITFSNLKTGEQDSQMIHVRYEDLLSLLAGEPITVFGKQVKFVPVWLEDRPFNARTEDEWQAHLQRMRELR